MRLGELSGRSQTIGQVCRSRRIARQSLRGIRPDPRDPRTRFIPDLEAPDNSCLCTGATQGSRTKFAITGFVMNIEYMTANRSMGLERSTSGFGAKTRTRKHPRSWPQSPPKEVRRDAGSHEAWQSRARPQGDGRDRTGSRIDGRHGEQKAGVVSHGERRRRPGCAQRAVIGARAGRADTRVTASAAGASTPI